MGNTLEQGELAAERAERIEQLWRRYCRLLRASRKRRPPDPGTPQGRLGALVWAGRRGKIPAGTIHTALEAADLHLDMNFRPATPLASTRARPGSAAKVAVLARRIERGEDLWACGDPVAWDEGQGRDCE